MYGFVFVGYGEFIKLMKSFKQYSIWVIPVLSIVITFLCGLFPMDQPVPLWAVLILIIGASYVCVVIHEKSKTSSVFRLPLVKQIKTAEDGTVVFIVEKNDLFSYDAYVSVFYQESDDDLESYIGLGFVQSINSKGNLQIEFRPHKRESSDCIYNLLLRNTSAVRNSIKIKPCITKDRIKEVLEEE